VCAKKEETESVFQVIFKHSGRAQERQGEGERVGEMERGREITRERERESESGYMQSDISSG